MIRRLSFILLVGAGVCFADMTVKTYLEADRVLKGVYLNGVGQGFEWANDWLMQSHRRMMYCVPESLPLNGESYLPMVDRQIELLEVKLTKADFDSMPIPLLLRKALIESFPCSSSPPAKKGVTSK